MINLCCRSQTLGPSSGLEGMTRECECEPQIQESCSQEIAHRFVTSCHVFRCLSAGSLGPLFPADLRSFMLGLTIRPHPSIRTGSLVLLLALVPMSTGILTSSHVFSNHKVDREHTNSPKPQAACLDENNQAQHVKKGYGGAI